MKWRTINNIYGVLQSRAWKYNSSKLRRRWPCAAGSGCRMTLSEDSDPLLASVKNPLQQTMWWWSRNWKLVVRPKLDLHTVTIAGAPCFTYDTNKVQWSFFCILFFTDPRRSFSRGATKFGQLEVMLRRSQTAWGGALTSCGHPLWVNSTVDCECAW